MSTNDQPKNNSPFLSTTIMMNDSRQSSSSYGEAAYAYDDDYYDARDGQVHHEEDSHRHQEQDDVEHESMHRQQYSNRDTPRNDNANDVIEDDDQDDDENEDSVSNEPTSARETIALFGATSPTGHHFLRLALDAGYRIRALIPPGASNSNNAAAAAATTNASTSGSVLLENEELYTVIGTVEDMAKVQEVVYSASYVVCMLTEALVPSSTTSTPQPVPLQEQQQNQQPENQQQPPPQSSSSKGPLLSFVQRLYSLMLRQDDPVISGFLFQATSLSADGRGFLPALSKVVRSMHFKKRSDFLQDMDAAISYVYEQEDKIPFPYIVTRPTLVLRDGPSTKKLAASKSVGTIIYRHMYSPIWFPFFIVLHTHFVFTFQLNQQLPGPFPYSYVDLAEFSLNALKMKKVFNSCPYVVGDGYY